MNIALICCIIFLGFGVWNYPKWSYKAMYDRGERTGVTCKTCPERYSEEHCTGKCPK